ncbi:MAG: TMEM14 family protein [Verrucomicrobia bacterium]|nr:TMEM14 family protein [Verrucomicrobiota bacterium]
MKVVVLLYAIIILVGGFIGHIKSGSTASLIAGLSCGILLLGSWWAMVQDFRWGWGGAMAVSLILLIFFTLRYFKTHSFMPPGFLALLSFAVFLSLVISFFKSK